MIDPDSVFLLGHAMHKNLFAKEFDLDSDEHKHVQDHLWLTVEGTIMGVSKEKVMPYFSDPEVKKLRMGLIKSSTRKEFPLANEDDFFKIMAIFVSLEEYC